MFYYYLYNHTFVSDIPLFNIPTVQVSTPNPDVIIRKGMVSYKEYLKGKNYIYLKKNLAIIRFIYGALKICFGKEIIYELDPDIDEESATPFIMGWGLAIILSQMGYSTFHCSALVRDNQCFFISGVSGAGKSTTSLQLIKHGCKYLCDDIAIVDSYENMLIPPAFPIQKVCLDVSTDLDKNKLYAISNERKKYAYINLDDFCDTPKRLSFFFELIPSDKSTVVVEEITGIRKYYKVMENLFLEVQYALSAFPENEKFQCLKISSNIRFFTISRPKGKNTLDEITNIILDILDKKEYKTCLPSGE